MKTIHNLFLTHKIRTFCLIGTLLSLVVFTFSNVLASDIVHEIGTKRDHSIITTGSGSPYKTIVERYTEGELSSEDLHQVSLLASRIVNHLNDAATGLRDQNAETAKPEILHAQKLIKVVRDLLPVTTVETIVKDRKGTEIYRDVDKIQDDKISLYQGMTAMEVVEPIIDAKEKVAELKGLRLADATVIHTSVLADISYIERKLNSALALLDRPDEALAQLNLIQTKGIKIAVNNVDNPLVKLQHALRLAERMVEEGKHEAAQDNLRLAQIQLGMYRALLGKEDSKVVKQLEEDIAELIPKTQEKEAASKIRKFWERAVDWFKDESGQAHVVENHSNPKL